METDPIILIANAKDHDSLGAHYPYWKWDKVNPLESKPAKQALSHQKKLKDFLQHSSSRSRGWHDEKI